jgi:hypothetical protein
MRNRIIPLAAGIAIGAAALFVPGVAWAPPGGGGGDAGSAPVREQNLDSNGNIKVHEQGTANVNVVNGDGRGLVQSTVLLANAGTNDSTHCQSVVLPGGNFVLEHVHASFTGPVDVFLRIPRVTEGSFGGFAHSSTNVFLTAAPQNLAEREGRVSELHTAIIIHDAFAEVEGWLFRDSDEPVEVCAIDATPGVGHGGPVVISGYVVR